MLSFLVILLVTLLGETAWLLFVRKRLPSLLPNEKREEKRSQGKEWKSCCNRCILAALLDTPRLPSVLFANQETKTWSRESLSYKQNSLHDQCIASPVASLFGLLSRFSQEVGKKTVPPSHSFRMSSSLFSSGTSLQSLCCRLKDISSLCWVYILLHDSLCTSSFILQSSPFLFSVDDRKSMTHHLIHRHSSNKPVHQ